MILFEENRFVSSRSTEIVVTELKWLSGAKKCVKIKKMDYPHHIFLDS